MKFVVFDRCQRGSELYQQWSALARSPLEHPAWLLTWWEVYGQREGGQMMLVAIYDGSQLIAISPLYLHGSRMQLLGCGEVCTDHQELLIGSPRREAIEPFLHWLLTDAKAPPFHHLQLDCIDRIGETYAAGSQLQNDRWGLMFSSEAVGTCEVSLPKTWEDYLAGLSKNHRKRCRRWERKYFATDRITTRTTLDGWDKETAVETLIRLHDERRYECEGEPPHAGSRFASFLKQAFHALDAEDLVEISALAVDEEIVAAEFELIGEDTVYAYQSGLSRGGSKHSAGSLSLLHRMQTAIRQGKRTYDFMRGTEPYKYHWGARVNRTVQMKLWRSNFTGHFMRSSNLLINHSRRFVRDWVSSS